MADGSSGPSSWSRTTWCSILEKLQLHGAMLALFWIFPKCLRPFFMIVVNNVMVMHRIIGAVLIITGLYLVLWGKNEERKFGVEKTAILRRIKPSVTQPLLINSSNDNLWLWLPIMFQNELVCIKILSFQYFFAFSLSDSLCSKSSNRLFYFLCSKSRGSVILTKEVCF